MIGQGAMEKQFMLLQQYQGFWVPCGHNFKPWDKDLIIYIKNLP